MFDRRVDFETSPTILSTATPFLKIKRLPEKIRKPSRCDLVGNSAAGKSGMFIRRGSGCDQPWGAGASFRRAFGKKDACKSGGTSGMEL